MDPAVLGTRLASSALVPALRKLIVQEGPGAGLTDRPVRLSGLVSFRGEKRTLTADDLLRLARRLVTAALDGPGEPPFPAAETEPVVHALADTLHALGDLAMDDVQAVRLGPTALARALRRAAPDPGLSADADLFLDTVTGWACDHILQFFTQRSTFVARTLVEQSRGQHELLAKTDELIRRTPPADAQDTAFERRYLSYVAERHRHLTIYGIDLRDAPERWPLEVAYLSLEATTTAPAGSFDDLPAAVAPARIRAEDAFDDDHDRVLLRGEAGSGKTTLIQWLAVTAADRVPFVLPLRTLVRTAALPAPADFLSSVGCPLTAPGGWAERVLGTGRALVLVDGLDEIPAADRHRVRDWVTSLIGAYAGNRWLLTSRPTAVRADWLADSGFREVLLPPMRGADVATFVRRWHTAADAGAYEGALLDALRTKRDLARLATNPLMCGLICALHRERRGYLPTGRKELYDAALSMLLTRRDRERGMAGVDLGEEAQLELLQHLAYALFLGGRTEMSRDAAEAALERRLPSVASASPLGDAPAVLSALLLRSGLLRQPADGVVDFVHRTFQDYLAARHAVEEGLALPFVQRLSDDPSGEDAIRMTVAHARPGERPALLRELLASGTPRLTLLALACLEHATTLAPDVRAEVERAAAALIPPRTSAAAKELAEAGPLVLELLPGPEGLSDEEAHGVTITASILGSQEPVGALGVLRRYREHASLDVRRQLAGTWERFGTEEYASEVLDHLVRQDLHLPCELPDQVAALAQMRPWRELLFRGPHTLRDIFAALRAPGTVTYLALQDNPMVEDLSALLACHALDWLQIAGCPNVRDVAPLSALPLTFLACDGSVAGLAGLRSLRRLSLTGVVPGTSLVQRLPVDAPLEFLFLDHHAIRTTGLRGLRHWQTLSTLSLAAFTLTPPTMDWQEIAALPALTSLAFDAALFQVLPGALAKLPELPGVTTLTLTQVLGSEDIDALPHRLPHVKQVFIHNLPGKTLSADRYARLFPRAEITLIPR
ncbi:MULTISPECIES: NACHT domain-containing protein [unclassified Streptomyces]|uniref:NACHT domain-containing protein n=1 Tax=unclassified Streptomyces TaxID=2593676 RepID=UPI000DB92EA3|nr:MULTISPECIES: NACHT domain-containing protein [unclassified Streptomyces]MYT69804.1 NACHT domain-containing protein [Streptomyces sp. SID8367]RAJ88376.1 NACHT domain-containing protein [Streptomyces sp. PsTaAH-137]